MKLDYTPLVDIRAVKADKGKGLKGAILETAKYPVKPFDVTDEKTDFTDQEKLQIVDDMLTGLHRKRQIGFGKLFKEIKKQTWTLTTWRMAILFKLERIQMALLQVVKSSQFGTGNVKIII